MFCDICLFWYHEKCIDISNDCYAQLSNSAESWYCCKCLNDILPFCGINDVEFATLHDNTNFVLTDKLTNIFNNRQFNPFNWQNVTDNNDEVLNCNYFLPNEFDDAVNSYNLRDNVSCFHLNCRSLTV